MVLVKCRTGARCSVTISQILIDQGNKEGYRAVMEARDQLLLLGRTISVDVSPAASAPVGSLMVEDEQTGEIRPISKKERQRLKKDARKAKREMQSQAGQKTAASMKDDEAVMQIGGDSFYAEGKAEKPSAFKHAPADASVDSEVVGSHVVAPVSHEIIKVDVD